MFRRCQPELEEIGRYQEPALQAGRVWPILGLSRYDGPADPPPLHWKPCHPSTARRFKAEMTCSAGHGLVLKGHRISDDGRVNPSVVCMMPGCSFHEVVRLQAWDFGEI